MQKSQDKRLRSFWIKLLKKGRCDRNGRELFGEGRGGKGAGRTATLLAYSPVQNRVRFSLNLMMYQIDELKAILQSRQTAIPFHSDHCTYRGKGMNLTVFVYLPGVMLKKHNCNNPDNADLHLHWSQSPERITLLIPYRRQIRSVWRNFLQNVDLDFRVGYFFPDPLPSGETVSSGSGKK